VENPRFVEKVEKRVKKLQKKKKKKRSNNRKKEILKLQKNIEN